MFYDRLKELCTQINTTPTALLKQLNISPSKGTVWKNGSEPSLKYLILFSDFFNVSIDFLVGRQETKEHYNANINGNANTTAIGSHAQVNVSDNSENKEVIETLNSLPIRERSKVITTIYELAEKCKGE